MDKILEDLKINTTQNDLLTDEERIYEDKVISTFEHNYKYVKERLFYENLNYRVIYNIKTGLVSAISVGATVMLGMGYYPLYVFSGALIIILATSCFAVGKFNRLWKNILGQVGFVLAEIMLLVYFKKYCEELGMIYEKNCRR